MNALSPEIIVIIIYILSTLSLILVINTFFIWGKFKKLTRGTKGSLDNVIQKIGTDVDELIKFKEDSTKYFLEINDKISRSIKEIPLTTFKAFDGLNSGGKNSFVTIFVNDEGNGVILSALHSRDRINIYAKEIKQWKSERMLTEEEEELLTNTLKSRNI
jgi:hypothetical protein